MKLRYYMFLFKKFGESWSASKQLLAWDEEDAYEQAMKYAEKHGYVDFILT